MFWIAQSSHWPLLSFISSDRVTGDLPGAFHQEQEQRNVYPSPAPCKRTSPEPDQHLRTFKTSRRLDRQFTHRSLLRLFALIRRQSEMNSDIKINSNGVKTTRHKQPHLPSIWVNLLLCYAKLFLLCEVTLRNIMYYVMRYVISRYNINIFRPKYQNIWSAHWIPSGPALVSVKDRVKLKLMDNLVEG